jgi:uncharacterized protein YkwD
MLRRALALALVLTGIFVAATVYPEGRGSAVNFSGPRALRPTVALERIELSSSSGGASSVESRLLRLVNSGRASRGKGAWTMHGGLRGVARGHDANMSSQGRLSHDGFPRRIDAAMPDPRQRGGPPDSGFHDGGFAACENVARYRPAKPASDEDVAQTFYKGWLNSSPHRRCMFDERKMRLNVTGIGVIKDSSGTWWGTLEAVRDATPPR